MKLEPSQEEFVRRLAAEGASLSDIQARLADEQGVRLSYLDTRLLLIELGVDLAEKPEKKRSAPADISTPAAGDYGAAPPLGAGAQAGEAGDDAGDPGDDGFAAPDSTDGDGTDGAAGDAGATGAVKVDLDRIQRPGFAASGAVTCSDGVKGQWGIDDYGRLALAFPDNKGYRPSAADQQAFMDELRNLLSGGY